MSDVRSFVVECSVARSARVHLNFTCSCKMILILIVDEIL